mmetsp:Transcript_23027/g.31978  ORF Transcript_23027/g.31978 Transcript_23027/m.31978 type:complete len:143 (-) Transcript_23027:99-527(-)
MANGKAVNTGQFPTIPLNCASLDASTEWGMGGFLDGDWFQVSWDSIRAQVVNRRDFFPFGTKDTSTIAYLELFTVYWFLCKFGPRLAGFSVPVFEDNQAVIGMINKLKGKPTYTPLIKEIHLLMVKFIRDSISITSSPVTMY